MEKDSGRICQWGRYLSGKKRRWTRAEKNAVKRARVEELLSIARVWKKEREEEIEKERSTTPTRGGVGKWVEELPWELWELIFENLNAADRLSCVTSAKVMIGRYTNVSSLTELREEAHDEMRAVRDALYGRRIKAAVDYYLLYNIHLRQPGVSYKYVAKRFKVERPELKEEIGFRLDPCFDSASTSED